MIWDLILRSSFLSFIFVFGLIGNVFVIYFFSFKMRKAPNFRWLIVHLAIADVIYGIITPTQFLYLLYTNGEWRLGVATCKFVLFVSPLTTNVSAWILCYMGYERHRAICYPFLPRLSVLNINIGVFFIWLTCMLLKLLHILRGDVHMKECVFSALSSTEYNANAILTLLVDSLIPMVLLIYFLLRVNVTLRLRARYLDDLRSNVPSINMNSIFLAQRKNFYRGVKNSENDPLVKINDQQSNQFRLSRAVSFCEKRRNAICFDPSLQRAARIAQAGYCTENIEDLNICRPLSSKNQLRCQNHSINTLVATISRKRASLKELSRIRIKEAGDRAIINVFSLTVIAFFLSSLPYNIFYLVVILLYSSFFTEDDIKNHRSKLMIANNWLSLLVVFGCVINIFIYSGMFPDFRRQMHGWLRRKSRRTVRLFFVSWKNILIGVRS
ncbi:cysteinyl leukotriene receptor 1 [Hydra vulgaris]|uniref:Cysteinyl leukotriene receptor 1 n=1 Tax=Hydra vulgaris TaxID=6087 RepID=A0ABM4DF93_HYDVU